MLSLPPKAPNDPEGTGVDPEEFRSYFIRSGDYTAGVSTTYSPSMITGTGRFQAQEGFRLVRFHSAQVLRLADAKPLQLGHVARADGAWRIYVFADAVAPSEPGSKARMLCEFVESDGSPIRRFTPRGTDPDSVFDVRAVFQQRHSRLKRSARCLLCCVHAKGNSSSSTHEKVFCPDPEAEYTFSPLRGVSQIRKHGCMVLVRPGPVRRRGASARRSTAGLVTTSSRSIFVRRTNH